jgi:hypothetical protein
MPHRATRIVYVRDPWGKHEPERHFEDPFGVLVGRIMLDCPYAVGDVIAVKEAWTWTGHGEDCLYRADSCDGPFKVLDIRWESAVQMPDYAVRTHLLALSVDCHERDGVWRWMVQVKKENKL